MSTFNELSQAIGIAVHKATKDKDRKVTPEVLTLWILRSAIHENYNELYDSINKLVNHTLKMTDESTTTARQSNN